MVAEELSFTVGKTADVTNTITTPHKGIIREVKLTLSGAGGNVSNPGNTKLAFYTATAATKNLSSVDQGTVTGLNFVAAPSGFVKAETGAAKGKVILLLLLFDLYFSFN